VFAVIGKIQSHLHLTLRTRAVLGKIFDPVFSVFQAHKYSVSYSVMKAES